MTHEKSCMMLLDKLIMKHSFYHILTKVPFFIEHMLDIYFEMFTVYNFMQKCIKSVSAMGVFGTLLPLLKCLAQKGHFKFDIHAELH